LSREDRDEVDSHSKEFVMRLRELAAIALAVIGLVAAGEDALAQTARRSPIDVKAHVLDRLFPLDGESKPRYFDKVIVRFSASFSSVDPEATQAAYDTQLVLVTYLVDPPLHPLPECELIFYNIRTGNGESLSKLVTRMLEQNPNVSETEIAAAIVVSVTRRPIPLKERDKILGELAAVRLSPLLASRLCLDDCPTFDYWYESGGRDVVHFTLHGDSGKELQNRLVKWMIKFRSVYAR
jgi:hypothetical protein